MGFLLGGSKSSSASTQNSQSTSGNQGFDFLKETYAPQAQQGVQAGNAIGNLLGIGGDPSAQQGAFQNFLNSTGYNFQLGQGQRAITGSNAAGGLLNSGSALKALAKYGQNLGASSFQNYLANLSGVQTAGQNAGNIIGGAGGVSQSTSQGTSTSSGKQKEGLLSAIGSLF